MAERTVVFDVMGTLFDLARVRDAIGGAAPLEAWFERTLHTAASLTLIGEYAPFQDVARAALAVTCAKLELDVDADRVVAALAELEPFPDAREAVELASPHVATLTNGGAANTRKLLDRAGLGIETVLTVEEVRAYKPSGGPYELARERLGDCTLIAAHAWDVAGARAAGLPAVWVDRGEREWPLPGIATGDRASGLVEAVRVARG